MNFGQRGASYILSAIILTMIMFAVAGGLYYWSNSLQLEQQGTAEQSQERLFDTLGACISVTSIDYDTLTNKSDVIFRNCGNSNMEIGDDKIRDIGVLQAPGIDPCSFNLNGSTCIGCPFRLEPGSSRLIVLNWSRELTCAEKITKGVKHQIVFYIDRLSTTSKVFAPEDVVTTTIRASTATNPGSGGATCDVTLSNTSSFESQFVAFTANKPSSFCFNVTVNNTGNIQDSFSLYGSSTVQNQTLAPPGGTLNCLVRTTGCSGNAFSSITIAAGSSQLVSYNASIDLDAPASSNAACNFTFSAQSDSCPTKYATTGSAQLRTS